ncbi:hypothetical protein ACI3LY_001440 [Candidozyma auris]|nr:hypothetical protein CA7LBN_004245 [[Candida] auris]
MLDSLETCELPSEECGIVRVSISSETCRDVQMLEKGSSWVVWLEKLQSIDSEFSIEECMLENPVFVEVSNVKLSCDELNDNVDNKDDDSDANDDAKDDSNNDEEADETAEERYEEYDEESKGNDDEEDDVNDIVCEGDTDSDLISSEDSRFVVLGSSSFDEDSPDSWRLDSKDDDNDANDDEEDDVIDIVCEGDTDSSESTSSEDSRFVAFGSSSFADSWRLDSKDDDNDANDDEGDDVIDIVCEGDTDSSESTSSEDSRCVVLGSSSFDEESLDSWRLDSKVDDNDANDDEEDDVIDIVCEGDTDSSESIFSEDSRCVKLGSSSVDEESSDSWRLDSD